MKKTLKEWFVTFVILFIIIELRLYVPMLQLSKIVFPQLYYSTQANVVDIEEERWRMVEGVVYSKHTTIEYTLDGKKYISKLFYRKSDKEKGFTGITVCKKFPNIIFRDNMGMPTMIEIVSLITLIQSFIYLFKIKWYEPDKVVKTDKGMITSLKEKLPNLFLFLKKNNSLELFDEISMTQEKKNLNDLCELGLYFDEHMDSKIINETESEWAINHKKGYIIIGRKDDIVILYKIDEGFIYSFDEHTGKYNFEAGGLIKYLKMHDSWQD